MRVIEIDHGTVFTFDAMHASRQNRYTHTRTWTRIPTSANEDKYIIMPAFRKMHWAGFEVEWKKVIPPKHSLDKLHHFINLIKFNTGINFCMGRSFHYFRNTMHSSLCAAFSKHYMKLYNWKTKRRNDRF